MSAAERARPLARVRAVAWAKRAVLLGVPLAYVAVLLALPLAAVVRGALADGALAFARAVTSDGSLAAFASTLSLTAFAVVLNTVFGVAIAWVLARDPFRGRRVLGGLVDVPFAISPVMVGLMAMLIFGRRGWLRPALDRLGVEVLFSWPGMALATAFVSLPLVVREVVPVLEEVGTAEEEAARTLGASRLATLWHVILPNIRWALVYGVLLTIARSLGEFGAVLVVGGNISGKTETATLAIWRALEERSEVEAHALAVVLASVSVGLLLVMQGLERRQRRASAERAEVEASS